MQGQDSTGAWAVTMQAWRNSKAWLDVGIAGMEQQGQPPPTGLVQVGSCARCGRGVARHNLGSSTRCGQGARQVGTARTRLGCDTDRERKGSVTTEAVRQGANEQ